MSVSNATYRSKRNYLYAFLTFFALILPFIKINGHQIFLLSFDKKQLHLMGTAFDMQELYLMPFLLMFMFIGIFAMTTIGGRAFCGWGCPQTIFRVIYRDLIETNLLKLRKRISNKQIEPDWSKKENSAKRVVGITIWAVLSLLASANFLWFFIPPSDFFAYMSNPMEHTVLLGFWLGIAGFLIYDIVFIKENWCIYVCPYSRVQSVLYDEDTLQPIYTTQRGGVIYDDNKEKVIFKAKDFDKASNAECTTCESCVTVCPTHIDIRKGTQLECINCLECVDACTKVMGKLGKESLVNWTSLNAEQTHSKVKLLRAKTIMYGVLLGLILVALTFMSGKKEYMLLNINKTTELYKISEDKQKVSNLFLLLFQNTQDKPYTYKIEVVGEYKGKVNIERFDEVKLRAGRMAKKVIMLSTTQKLVNDATKDTPLTVTLKAYAVENPKEVVVFRKAIFIYPRADKLQ
ncbi:MAG: cytochrome c oxidase accessory protein CcoG [Epsilonproteobacteria bacterium]|nr:cytochrome c oxidase accessory protein CcoG [Campylobacterota bacterium]